MHYLVCWWTLCANTEGRRRQYSQIRLVTPTGHIKLPPLVSGAQSLAGYLPRGSRSKWGLSWPYVSRGVWLRGTYTREGTQLAASPRHESMLWSTHTSDRGPHRRSLPGSFRDCRRSPRHALPLRRSRTPCQKGRASGLDKEDTLAGGAPHVAY